MKGLKVTKIIKDINVEDAWGELQAKKGYQRNSLTKEFEINCSFHVK